MLPAGAIVEQIAKNYSRRPLTIAEDQIINSKSNDFLASYRYFACTGPLYPSRCVTKVGYNWEVSFRVRLRASLGVYLNGIFGGTAEGWHLQGDILRYLQDHLLGASLEVVLGVYPRNKRAAFV